MKKILISGYTGLGNFILKTPLIKKIKESYPDSEIDIIAGNSYGAEFVLKDDELINETYILKENSSTLEKIKFFLSLRKMNYDVIFLPFDSNRRFLFFCSYFARVKLRVVHLDLRSKIKNLFYMFMPLCSIVPLLPGRHEIDLNYDLLESYINKPFNREYETFIHIKYNKNVLSKFNIVEKKYITIQVGAANGIESAKKWKIENFASLILKINKEIPDYQIVIVGDSGDYENDIKRLEQYNISFINTAGLTTIDEVANILYYSRLVIAHDSGLMHMANALKCHLIALYGPTDYTRTKPLGINSYILYSKTDCFGKMYNFSGNETELLVKYPNCMDGITVVDVFNKISKVILSDK